MSNGKKRVPDESNDSPANKRRKMEEEGDPTCFCSKSFKRTELLIHFSSCELFKGYFSDIMALRTAKEVYGDSLEKDMERFRLVLKRDIENDEDRKKILQNYLKKESEKHQQREKEASSELMRIPIVCTLPSCSREEGLSVRGIVFYELPIRTIVNNEKRPLASRYEQDAIRFRSMILGGDPLPPRNTNFREKRSVPDLISMSPSRPNPKPGPSSRSSEKLLTPPSALLPPTSLEQQQPDNIVSQTMEIQMNHNQPNLSVTVSYTIPTETMPVLSPITPQRPVTTPRSSVPESRQGTNLRISKIVSIPNTPVQTAGPSIPVIQKAPVVTNYDPLSYMGNIPVPKRIPVPITYPGPRQPILRQTLQQHQQQNRYQATRPVLSSIYNGQFQQNPTSHMNNQQVAPQNSMTRNCNPPRLYYTQDVNFYNATDPKPNPRVVTNTPTYLVVNQNPRNTNTQAQQNAFVPNGLTFNASQVNPVQNQQTAPSVMRIKTVKEINNTSFQTLVTPREQFPPNTPPSPPSTPSTPDEKFDIRLIRRGKDLQIYTGIKNESIDIVEHSGETRNYVKQRLLDRELIAGIQKIVEQERSRGQDMSPMLQQLQRFFNNNVPIEYNFLLSSHSFEQR